MDSDRDMGVDVGTAAILSSWVSEDTSIPYTAIPAITARISATKPRPITVPLLPSRARRRPPFAKCRNAEVTERRPPVTGVSPSPNSGVPVVCLLRKDRARRIATSPVMTPNTPATTAMTRNSSRRAAPNKRLRKPSRAPSGLVHRTFQCAIGGKRKDSGSQGKGESGNCICDRRASEYPSLSSSFPHRIVR